MRRRLVGGLRRHGRRARCRRSCGAPRSPSPSSTTTCSAPARSTPTRRCCGCATSATGSRSWRRSCPTTATRTRSSSTAASSGSSTRYTSTSRYPYAQRIGTDVQLTDDSGLDTRRQLRPQQRQGRRRRLRRLGHVLRQRRRRPDRQGVAGRVRRPLHARLGDAGRAARAPALPGGPVPGADRRLLQVPARARAVLPAPGRLVGRPGAEHRPARDRRGRRAGAEHERGAGAGRRSRRRPRRAASRRTTRCSADPTATTRTSSSCARSCRSRSDDRRTELQAYMTASSDPDNYGQLTAYVRRPTRPTGPRTVSNNIDSEPAIATTITQQTGGGNQVRFGDLQIVPVADGLLWVRPMYAVITQDSDGSPGSGVGDFRFVIASYNDNVADRRPHSGKPSPACSTASMSISAIASGPATGARRRTRRPATSRRPTTPEEVLARADELLREAEAALEDDNDLGEYQAKVDEATALIDEALDALQPATTTPAGEPSTDTTAPATDSTVHGRRLSSTSVSSPAARRSRRRPRRSGRRCGSASRSRRYGVTTWTPTGQAVGGAPDRRHGDGQAEHAEHAGPPDDARGTAAARRRRRARGSGSCRPGGAGTPSCTAPGRAARRSPRTTRAHVACSAARSPVALQPARSASRRACSPAPGCSRTRPRR